MVYDTAGDPVKLEKGVNVFDADGQRGRVRRLKPAEDEATLVDLQAQALHLERRTDGSVEDMELGFKLDCDKESGATTFNL